MLCIHPNKNFVVAAALIFAVSSAFRVERRRAPRGIPAGKFLHEAMVERIVRGLLVVHRREDARASAPSTRPPKPRADRADVRSCNLADPARAFLDQQAG